MTDVGETVVAFAGEVLDELVQGLRARKSGLRRNDDFVIPQPPSGEVRNRPFGEDIVFIDEPRQRRRAVVAVAKKLLHRKSRNVVSPQREGDEHVRVACGTNEDATVFQNFGRCAALVFDGNAVAVKRIGTGTPGKSAFILGDGAFSHRENVGRAGKRKTRVMRIVENVNALSEGVKRVDRQFPGVVGRPHGGFGKPRNVLEVAEIGLRFVIGTVIDRRGAPGEECRNGQKNKQFFHDKSKIRLIQEKVLGRKDGAAVHSVLGVKKLFNLCEESVFRFGPSLP